MQPDWEIFYHRKDLSHLGKLENGKPKYRIVLAETRREIFQGKWLSHYGPLKGWVLEGWMSPEEYAGPEKGWFGMLLSGGLDPLTPYPREGSFEMMYHFTDNSEIDAAEVIIKVIKADFENMTDAERMTALRIREKLKEEAQDEEVDNILEAALSGPDPTRPIFSLPTIH